MNRFMRKCVMDRKIVEQLIQKKSFNKISKQLKVSKVRIREIFDKANELGYLDQNPLPPYPEALFDYKEQSDKGPVSDVDKELLKHLNWIKERREAGWHLITILEELPQTTVEVTKSSFYRFIKRHQIDQDKEHSRCRSRVIPKIIHEPGESLILDWGKLCDVIDPKTDKKGHCGFYQELWVTPDI